MKLLFLLSIILLSVFPLYPDDNEIAEQFVYRPYRLYGLWGNIAYSDSGIESENFTAGLNFTIFNAPPGGMIIVYTIQTFGADYQYHGNKNGSESIFRIDYTYFGYFAWLGVGGGISTFYNISNNNIGIAPQFGGSVFLWIIKINYYYRYNVVLNNIKNNYHETVVSVNIGNVFVWSKK
jgi:hypothetical protein